MSEAIMILGDTGTGKSYSCRNLDPATTLLVSVDGKRYPFRLKGWEKLTPDNVGGSLYHPPKGAGAYSKIQNAVKTAVSNGKKVIVLDDTQFLMANEFFARAMETGYGKFTEMATKFHTMIDFAGSLPDDVTVYFMHHLEYEGESRIKVKTCGKMLDSQTNVAGKFTVCLLAQKLDEEYKFCANIPSQGIVKAPPGMFEVDPMDNDLAAIDTNIREYWGI